MRKLLWILFPLTACMAVFCGTSQAAFYKGEELAHQLTICLKKSDAIAIVDAHSKSGYEAAKTIFEKVDECATMPVVGGPAVGDVVHSAVIVSGGNKQTAKVVEIVHEGKVVAYFITTQEWTEKKALKKERDL